MMNDEAPGVDALPHSTSNIHHPTLAVGLFEPEIPGNAGNVARLCAATGTELHLIGRLGFSLKHPAARRAGMDYWDRVAVHRHVTFEDFEEQLGGRRLWLFSTRGERSHWDAEYAADDVLLFGSESRGLPAELLAARRGHVLRIPMRAGERSLNLGSSAAVGLYEALRRIRPPDLDAIPTREP
jgi:tRNA (cytidine/uridine-2'-O-)-methyltransferase